MKLKQDCVRYVLLSLEAQGIGMLNQGAQGSDIVKQLSNEKFSADDITYTLWQLADGKFIKANCDRYAMGVSIIVFDITWQGHELLDSIRDDKVWSQTKKATSSLKSVSIGVLKNVATAVLSGMIKQATGLPI